MRSKPDSRVIGTETIYSPTEFVFTGSVYNYTLRCVSKFTYKYRKN